MLNLLSDLWLIRLLHCDCWLSGKRILFIDFPVDLGYYVYCFHDLSMRHKRNQRFSAQPASAPTWNSQYWVKIHKSELIRCLTAWDRGCHHQPITFGFRLAWSSAFCRHTNRRAGFCCRRMHWYVALASLTSKDKPITHSRRIWIGCLLDASGWKKLMSILTKFGCFSRKLHNWETLLRLFWTR